MHIDFIEVARAASGASAHHIMNTKIRFELTNVTGVYRTTFLCTMSFGRGLTIRDCVSLYEDPK